MPTIGQCLFVALCILKPAANLETVLVLDLLLRKRTLLTPEQRQGQDQEHQGLLCAHAVPRTAASIKC